MLNGKENVRVVVNRTNIGSHYIAVSYALEHWKKRVLGLFSLNISMRGSGNCKQFDVDIPQCIDQNIKLCII